MWDLHKRTVPNRPVSAIRRSYCCCVFSFIWSSGKGIIVTEVEERNKRCILLCQYRHHETWQDTRRNLFCICYCLEGKKKKLPEKKKKKNALIIAVGGCAGGVVAPPAGLMSVIAPLPVDKNLLRKYIKKNNKLNVVFKILNFVGYTIQFLNNNLPNMFNNCALWLSDIIWSSHTFF